MFGSDRLVELASVVSAFGVGAERPHGAEGLTGVGLALRLATVSRAGALLAHGRPRQAEMIAPRKGIRVKGIEPIAASQERPQESRGCT